jgi:hypothetical protein
MGEIDSRAVQEADNVFELGLTLAGAISAGAYTAGVLDFLFQALDEWDKHRGVSGTPQHRVVIKVIAGASAGAITGALSAVALARGLHPELLTQKEIDACFPSYRSPMQPYRCVLPAMWRTWVELPDMMKSGDGAGLLGLNDLPKRGMEVVSLLDATVLDRIKTTAIAAPEQEHQRGVRPPVQYISARLHIYMTLSNMRGIPYTVGFGRPDNKYGMITHGDRVHYIIEGLGDGRTQNAAWLDEDAKNAAIILPVKSLPVVPGTMVTAWDDYGSAALASGAFPIGLAPRRLSYAACNYLNRALPINLRPGVFIRPSFPASLREPAAPFVFQTVDGGIVNNNPFDYAQYALFGGPPTEDQKSGRARAIIMVAPFPDPPKFLPENAPAPTLAAILRALFPTLVNQARFRMSELAPALDERDYSRYLISPRRRIPRAARPRDGDAGAPEERFAIACGALGGFGGFLSESFRAHDFQLGRRNCQLFLAESLTARAGGIVQGAAARSGEIPVIPLFGSAAEIVPLPRWPQLDRDTFNQLGRRIQMRLDAVVPALIDGQTRSRRLRFFMRRGWSWFLRTPTRRYAQAMMLSDLVHRRQISDYEPEETVIAPLLAAGHSRDDVAGVIGELINPAFRFRTEEGIAAALDVTPKFVHATLTALMHKRVAPHLRSSRDVAGWAMWTRRPGFLERQKLFRPIFRWWNAPTVG